MRMLIFFAIVILFFGSVGYYLYNRISHTFSGTFLASRTFLILYIFLLSSFFLGKILENISMNFLSETLIRIGSYTLGFFLYALIAFLFFDLIRLIHRFIPIYPPFITENLAQVRIITGSLMAVAITALVGYGIWNSFQPRVKTLEIQIDKKVEGLSALNIVAVSDIHLGTMVNKIKAQRLMSEINRLEPDLVIIAGDIVDDNVHAVKKYGLFEYFNQLNPRLGVYGIMGNHEYIGRSYSEIPYYEQNNIQMLIDSVKLIDDKFYLVGRDDIQAKAFFNRDRKSLESLTAGLNKEKPIILLDHQPYDLSGSEKEGIDFQFSGHTHHGQFWPINYITGAMFENDWGYLKKGNTHFYISCGYGTAGPPMRIGSHPEIVHVNMKFKG